MGGFWDGEAWLSRKLDKPSASCTLWVDAKLRAAWTISKPSQDRHIWEAELGEKVCGLKQALATASIFSI